MLIGNSEKAKRELGWEPKIRWRSCIVMMVEADLIRNEHGISF